MTQMQEGEQQEEAKKPDGKRLWRAFYWFTGIFVSAVSFYWIGNWAIWFFHDIASTIGFMFFGIAVNLAFLVWRRRQQKIVALVGIILWTIAGWSMGYIYSAVNAHDSFLPVVFHQVNLIIVASVPYLLLGAVLFLVSTRSESGV